MRKYLSIALLLLPLTVSGQAHFRHLDSIELNKLRQNATQRAAKAPGSGGVVDASHKAMTDPLTLLMRVSDDEAVRRLEASGAEISLRAGNIILVETTLGDAERLAATEGVITVSLPEQLSMNEFISSVGYDLSRQWLGLDKMQAGAAPLPEAYTGQGVIVGVLDMGIDPNHMMFDDEDGNPRVKRIMNHVEVGGNRLTQKIETPEKIRQFKTDDDQNTHGTHVLGLVAGRYNAGSGGPDFSGGAPQADIAVKCGATDNARLLKGLEYITDYAREEGKPCVINISLGSNKGPHDGTDEFPAALQQFAAMEGVTICVSAGNEGADQAFLYHEAGDDAAPLKTFISPSQYTDYLYSQVAVLPMYPQAIGQMEIWSDDDTPFDVYYDFYDMTGAAGPRLVNSFRLEPFKTSYMSTTGSSPVAGADVTVFDNAQFNAHYRDSFVGGNSSLYPANNRFYAELNFQLECPDATAYSGGIMSLRVVPGKPGQKIYIYGLPMSGLFGYSLVSGNLERLGFTGSYGNGSVNAMAGARDVITVGSYVTHNFNPEVTGQYPVGTTSTFSSWGTTPDGRMHPLISAPGNLIVSSMSSYYYNNLGAEDAKDPRIVYYTATDKNGKENHWTIMSGTSMSSPYMAGIAAAWLSADPTLSSADILRIAQETASRPAETRVNDGAGYFVDAYAGLCKILDIAGIDNISADGGKPYTVSREGRRITVRMLGARSLDTRLFGICGESVLSGSALGGEITLDASSLPKGMYVLSIKAANLVYSEKIAII